MRVVKSKEDISLLQRARAVGSEFAKHLENFMDQLQADLDYLNPGAYKMEDCGYVVILEPGDNVRELSHIGLYRENGLLGCLPEWFDLVSLDGAQYYCFLELLNDAFGVIFYTAVGIHDEEVEVWLQAKLHEVY